MTRLYTCPCRVGKLMCKRINEEMDSHTTKIRRAFRRSVPFWQIFGNWRRSMWGSYSWLNTTRFYTSLVELKTLEVFMCMYMMVTSVPIKRWTLTLPKFNEPFGAQFLFERFLGINVGWCEGHTLGWGRQDSIHPRVEFETLGVFMCMYMVIMRINEEMDSHTTKIRQAIRRSVPSIYI